MMKTDIPAWAMRTATSEDLSAVGEAQRRDVLQIRWPDLTALRGWAKQHAWPTPWLGFEAAFIRKLLENQANFELGLNEGGVELRIPRRDYALSVDRLAELDALYAERSASGRPTLWGSLVEALREIRRAVEAGVAVKIEGTPPLRTWQDFYAWAHGRYHMLEDGYDKWIGDDAS